jgi:hypothetical protein
VLTEAHTVHWLYSLIAGLPTAGISWWTWYVGQPWPIVAAIAIGLFAAIFLCVLALLGYREESKETTNSGIGSRISRQLETTGFRVSGKDNTFLNVESVGFDTGFDVTETGSGNRFINTVAALFGGGKSPSLDRIPCTELLKIAASIGWDFSSSGSLHLLDLQDAMRQGGADGTLTIWGKLNKWSSDDLMRKELLEKIEPNHWKECFVHLFAATENDNFNVYSWSPTAKSFGKRIYIDLHVERPQALSWLRRDASSFRGRTKPR